mgnify:CR=1 FL=1
MIAIFPNNTERMAILYAVKLALRLRLLGIG